MTTRFSLRSLAGDIKERELFNTRTVNVITKQLTTLLAQRNTCLTRGQVRCHGDQVKTYMAATIAPPTIKKSVVLT